MPRLGMVIDLRKCVGCGACALACKAENNTRYRDNGQSYNWADFLIKTEGRFPDTTMSVFPVLCNHCTDAPCIPECPVEPKKAIYKTPEGITMHDEDLCIGCRACQRNCPYSHRELDDSSLAGDTYSVISFNFRRRDSQPQWTDKGSIIPGCTASGAETAAKAGAVIPNANLYDSKNLTAVRGDGKVEKCTFCYHRVSNGMQPACVEACPSQARVFGDQDDPNSEISKILKANASTRLKEELGTKPNVHYINKYSVRA